MVDPDGRVHSISAGSAVSADHVATDFTWQWVPSSWRGGTVNGTTAYASFIQRDNPQGALAMLRVPDEALACARGGGDAGLGAHVDLFAGGSSKFCNF